MTSDAKKMTRRLKAKRRSLLQNYEHEDLHQLRVILRRIRSLLEHRPGGRARHLRRDMGMLADATNPARDWDTLVICAGGALAPDQIRQLQPWLEEQQAVTHQLVVQMLRSDQWSTAIKCWKEYVREADFKKNSPFHSRRGLPKAAGRVSSARRKALSRGDDNSWHKLRIAVKKLRYLLDDMPKGSRSPAMVATLLLCERLQDDLGEWHDSVVHLQLLHELAGSLERGLDVPGKNAMITLRQAIEQQGRDCLERVRATLERQGTDLEI